MKLTGSITESEYREELINSRIYLFKSNSGVRIFKALIERYGNFRSAYILTHTPEQDEDVFRILIDGKEVVGFDYLHEKGDINNYIVMSVKEYDHAVKSREARLRLAIALDLFHAEKGADCGAVE